MKTETKKTVQEKKFDTVKTFRVIKEKISLEMSNMNFEQIKEYLKTNSAKLYENKHNEIDDDSRRDSIADNYKKSTIEQKTGKLKFSSKISDLKKFTSHDKKQKTLRRTN